MRRGFLLAVFSASVLLALVGAILPDISIESKLLLVTLIVLVDTIMVMLVDYADTSSKLGVTVNKLEEVAGHMSLVATDIAKRNLLVTKLDAEFFHQGNLLKSVALPVNITSVIEVEVGNNGTMSALHAQWQIFFPPQLDVKEPGGLTRAIPQPPMAFYPNYSSFMYPANNVVDFAAPQTRKIQRIRFEVVPRAGTPVGPLEVIVNGHSSNGPQTVTKLQLVVQ